jgi:hypothetical protein
MLYIQWTSVRRPHHKFAGPGQGGEVVVLHVQATGPVFEAEAARSDGNLGSPPSVVELREREIALPWQLKGRGQAH